MTDRAFRALSGAVALLLFMGAVVIGAKIANGLLKDHYQLNATFAAAGQGLKDGSDVKIHGVNIGRVKRVSLRDGRARVRLEINGAEKVPAASKAVIRPKTLFGEKFVDIDPGTNEANGPFLRDEGEIKDTLGGFELERVLTDLYPILKAVKPEQLATIIHTLAAGGEGEGAAVNRQLENFEKLARVQAAHAADTQEFLTDLANLADELGTRGGDIVAGARDLNATLPALNQRGDELATVLEQGARLAADASDVLENNKPFIRKVVTEGGKTIQVLYDERSKIGPLVTGLRQFVQTLAEVGRIPFGDGTNLAAIKLVLGEDCPLGRGLDPVACPTGPAPLSANAKQSPARTGVDAIAELISRVGS
ncbi:MAG TPA: MlaD family protein [Acidimicrobiales bacterium]|nr:MlaD family protein [Acidimicrobiales bacterium]